MIKPKNTEGAAAPGYEGPSWLDKFLFYVTGFVLCAYKGQLRKYALLLAQADLETAGLTSHWFYRENNPWCMHAGSRTARRSGVVAADGGEVAVYKRGLLNAYYYAWSDRLEWDAKAGVNEAWQTPEQYMNNVMAAGWLGNVEPARKDQYVSDWMACYKRQPAWLRALCEGSVALVPGWVWGVSITAAILIALWYSLKALGMIRKLRR